MDATRFIQEAVANGEEAGPEKLDPLQRQIFLLSELEVCCDKDGIDAFLARYGESELRAVAALLRASGAAATAGALVRLADALPRHDADVLNGANALISNRAGYDYESVARVVAIRLAGSQ